MALTHRPIGFSFYCLLLLFFITACTRTTTEFGTVPENTYTNLVYVDTVAVQFSTVFTDSFVTGTASSFMIGRYKDPYLGTVSARPFLQFNPPSPIPEIPATAVFDSLTLIIKPNDYYYGDTSLLQTIQVWELNQTITGTYNDQLYNTSDIPVKPVPLGAGLMRISPMGNDSLRIRLSDDKGEELFNKIRQGAAEIKSSTDFLNYFKGISLSFADTDTTGIFGLLGEEGSMNMRLHYHLTIPYPEDKFINFNSTANSLAFNQILTNRSGTGLQSGNSGNTETPSALTGNLAFTQPGTGMYLKMIFPTLRGVLTEKSSVQLLKAELIIRPARLSFNAHQYKLPSQLYLAQTDATNTIGSAIYDSTGSAIQYADPVVDDIYGENNYYRFNMTSYINVLLSSGQYQQAGFYMLQSRTEKNVDRLVVNDRFYGSTESKLLLYLLVIDK